MNKTQEKKARRKRRKERFGKRRGGRASNVTSGLRLLVVVWAVASLGLVWTLGSLEESFEEQEAEGENFFDGFGEDFAKDEVEIETEIETDTSPVTLVTYLFPDGKLLAQTQTDLPIVIFTSPERAEEVLEVREKKSTVVIPLDLYASLSCELLPRQACQEASRAWLADAERVNMLRIASELNPFQSKGFLFADTDMIRKGRLFGSPTDVSSCAFNKDTSTLVVLEDRLVGVGMPGPGVSRLFTVFYSFLAATPSIERENLLDRFCSALWSFCVLAPQGSFAEQWLSSQLLLREYGKFERKSKSGLQERHSFLNYLTNASSAVLERAQHPYAKLRRGPFVFTRYSGGLGNRVFALASQIGISRNIGRETCGSLDETLEELFEYAPFRPCVPAKRFTVVREKAYALYEDFSPRIPNEYNVLVSGYLQSFRYFDFASEEVRSRLMIRRVLRQQAEDFIWSRCTQGGPDSAVGIHIRRGDKIGQEWFRWPPESYFEKAMTMFRESFGDLTCFIVVAEPLAVGFARHFPLFQDATVHLPDPDQDRMAVQDFALLANCRGGVISTLGSTFSLLATFLGSKQPFVYYTNEMVLDHPIHRGNFRAKDYYPSWAVQVAV